MVDTEEQAQQYVDVMTSYKSDHLTFGGWKLAVDGGVAAGTALMYDNTLLGGVNAYYFHQPEVLNRIVKLLHDTGLQIAFHIIGDKGIDEALDAVQAAFAASGRNGARHRIEHCWYPTPAALARIKALNMVVSAQSAMISWFADGYRAGSNDAMMARFMPIKTMLDNEIPVALGCDVPAAPLHEPKWDLLGATTRRSMTGYVPAPEERITIPAAVRLHTMGSAYAAFEEDVKGSIEAGKFADLVVWNQDLANLSDPMMLGYLRALMTVVGGKVVYRGGENQAFVPAVTKGR
jgi:hypothetical protein